MTPSFIEPLTLTAIAAVFWPFCRMSGFFMSMFFISNRSIPRRVRIMFAFTLTLCMLPALPAIPGDLQIMSVPGVLITIKEVLIGMAMGYVTQFLAQVFTIAGQTIAMQTGLGFASMVDPVSGTNSAVVGQFFSVLTTLVFLAINGHLLFIRMMVMSFTTLPIGGDFIPLSGIYEIVSFGSDMFLFAAGMAISSICTMLVINFTLGVMTRAAPQLNIFSMGFAVSMTTGLVVLTYALNAYLNVFYNAFNELVGGGCSLIATSCEGFLQ